MEQRPLMMTAFSSSPFISSETNYCSERERREKREREREREEIPPWELPAMISVRLYSHAHAVFPPSLHQSASHAVHDTTKIYSCLSIRWSRKMHD
uniref:Uncharacterized protein n=1 Tax=Oryza brachyantha TaxID=4533 RepID=J3MHM2_ORYBR